MTKTILSSAIVAQADHDCNTNASRLSPTLRAFQADPTDPDKIYRAAAAITHSVLNTCADPTRKTAAADPTEVKRKTWKQSSAQTEDVPTKLKHQLSRCMGYDHTEEKNGETVIVHHNGYLDNLAAAMMKETPFKSIDPNYEIVDTETMHTDLTQLVQNVTLPDCMDAVQDAVLAMLEQAAAHDNGGEWLEQTITETKTTKSVYAWGEEVETKEVETKPIQKIYAAVREGVEHQRSVKADPTAKHCYISIDTTDPETGNLMFDHVYFRLGKFADLGECAENMNGETLYTTESGAVFEFYETLGKLSLTRRQSEIVERKLCGQSVAVIAKRLHISEGNVYTHIAAAQERAAAVGFVPRGYVAAKIAEGNAVERKRAEDAKKRKVAQLDPKTLEVVAVFDSLSAAAKDLKINKGGISGAVKTNGTYKGYLWRIV